MPNKQSGFTLIELLVVIAIIGLLSTIVLASLGTARSKGVTASNQMALQQVKNALALYAADHNGNYPLATSSLVLGKYISAINPNIVYTPVSCNAELCSDYTLAISGGSGSGSGVPCGDPTKEECWSTTEGSGVWSYAIDYCAGLTDGGHSDWFLPSYAELEAGWGAFHLGVFSSEVYWSSTEYPDSPENFAWYLSTYYGAMDWSTKDHQYSIRCLR